MGDLKDFSEFAEPPLSLPIRGKVYEVPELSVADGLRLSGVLDANTSDAAPEIEGEELWQLVLGPAWDEMLSDHVGYKAIARAGFTAMLDFQYGRKTATAYWNDETPDKKADNSDPEAPAGQQPADTGTATPQQTPQVEASTTP